VRKKGRYKAAENAACVLWVGPQMCVILWDIRTQKARTCSRYAVWPSQPLQARSSSLSAHSLLNITLNRVRLTTHHFVSSVRAPMKVSGRRGRRQAGAVQDTTNTWAPLVRAVALRVELQASTKKHVYI